ncbi:MAG: hypothetical protein ACKPKO_44190, partial [Candidatus Fonsibacter sp.]
MVPGDQKVQPVEDLVSTGPSRGADAQTNGSGLWGGGAAAAESPQEEGIEVAMKEEPVGPTTRASGTTAKAAEVAQVLLVHFSGRLCDCRGVGKRAFVALT